MTVSSTDTYVNYACTGTDEYTYGFKIFEDADLLVKRTAVDGSVTTLTLTTDYTVADNGDGSGGTVTTVATYSNGHLSIELDLDYDQETEFSDGGPLPAEQLENALDKNVMLIKQLKNLVTDAALGISWQGAWQTATAYSTFDMVTNSGKWYVCSTAHTSDVFATDLGNAYWRLFLEEPSSHAIASHSDTTATGAELETLTDDSMADALHRHSELSASDGTPNPALSVDAAGLVSLINGTGINEFSTDGTLAGNSDDAVPTEKAVKTYSDANAKFYDAYVRVADVKSTGTNGGTTTTGSWLVRDIAETDDTGSIASVSANVITLAAGTYRCMVIVPTNNSQAAQARLYDVTGAAVLLIGSNGYADPLSINGRFTLTVQSEIRIEMRVSVASANVGMGSATSFGGDEVYTVAEFWREA